MGTRHLYWILTDPSFAVLIMAAPSGDPLSRLYGLRYTLYCTLYSISWYHRYWVLITLRKGGHHIPTKVITT